MIAPEQAPQFVLIFYISEKSNALRPQPRARLDQYSGILGGRPIGGFRVPLTERYLALLRKVPLNELYPELEGGCTISCSVGRWGSRWRALAIDQARVEALFVRDDLRDERMQFLLGWFRDTLPTAPIERLALIRLDDDLYESTFDALYDRLGLDRLRLAEALSRLPPPAESHPSRRTRGPALARAQSCVSTRLIWACGLSRPVIRPMSRSAAAAPKMRRG